MKDPELRAKFNDINRFHIDTAERLARVETIAQNTHDIVNTFIDKVPCTRNSDKISKNAVNIEKSKYSMAMATLSIVVSLFTVAGVVWKVFGA